MTTNKTEHERRQFLKTIVAIGLSGPTLYSHARANPLMWILRTGLVNSAVLLATGTLAPSENKQISSIRSQSVELDGQEHTDQASLRTEPFQQDPSTGDYKQQAYAEGDTSIEIWDSAAPRSLYLEIPPVAEVITDRLVVSMYNFETGGTQLIADSPLTVIPSQEYAYPEIPLRPLNIRGLFRFDASVPALGNDISISGTRPVLMQ